MKILVTGGTGKVGTEVVQAWQQTAKRNTRRWAVEKSGLFAIPLSALAKNRQRRFITFSDHRIS